MKPLTLLLGAIVTVNLACRERVAVETPSPPNASSGRVRLVAHPEVIHQGEKVVLRWRAPNMLEVTLEQAVDPLADVRAEFETIGTYPSTGSIELHPQQSVSYIVSCGNALVGCSSAAVHVIVK